MVILAFVGNREFQQCMSDRLRRRLRPFAPGAGAA
jgi:hypothetical protein